MSSLPAKTRILLILAENSWKTKIKIFPLSSISQLVSNILWVIVTLKVFYEGSPSCRRSFPFGLALFSNMLTKGSRANEVNFSSFILLCYCSAVITPFPYATAAIKWAKFSPVPLSPPLSVKPKSIPCPGFLQAIALGALACSKGVILWHHLSKSLQKVYNELLEYTLASISCHFW